MNFAKGNIKKAYCDDDTYAAICYLNEHGINPNIKTISQRLQVMGYQPKKSKIKESIDKLEKGGIIYSKSKKLPVS